MTGLSLIRRAVGNTKLAYDGQSKEFRNERSQHGKVDNQGWSNVCTEPEDRPHYTYDDGLDRRVSDNKNFMGAR